MNDMDMNMVRSLKKVNFREGLMTWVEWLTQHSAIVKSRPSVYEDFYDRRSYNRDSEGHEAKIRIQMLKKPLIYSAYGSHGDIYDIPKEVYEWAVANGMSEKTQ